MTINATWDYDTWGIGCFWQAGLKDETAPKFLRVSSITLILFGYIMSVEWGG